MDTIPQNDNTGATNQTAPQAPVIKTNGGNTGGIITIIIILVLLIAGGMYFYFTPSLITNDVDKNDSMETGNEDESLRKEFEASGDLNIEAEMQALDKEFE